MELEEKCHVLYQSLECQNNLRSNYIKLTTVYLEKKTNQKHLIWSFLRKQQMDISYFRKKTSLTHLIGSS